MDRGVGAAARLPGSDRKDLAIQALAGSGAVSDLAARHGVSRKFVYQQAHKAAAALDDAFSSATSDDEVLFELAVTKAWLHQVIVGLTLICRSSYRGVVEFLRDLLGLPRQPGLRPRRASVRHAAGERDQPRPGPVRHSRRLARRDLPGRHAGAGRHRCGIDVLLPAGGGAAPRRRHLGPTSAGCRPAGARS
jgi:hypothetical protein